MTPPQLRFVTLVACIFSIASAGFAAWRQDWTSDEPFHLRWAERLLDTGETERESQERFNSKTPVVIANVLAGKAAQAAGLSEPRVLRFAQRLPTVLWLALLLAATFLGGRALVGSQAAQLATIGVALDPNLLAHGSLATVDCLYALATLLSLVTAIAFARAPSVGRAALVGLAVGLALATKFTGVLLVLGLALTPLAAPPETISFWRERRRVLASTLVAAVVATGVLGAAYLGKGLAQPLRELRLTSGVLVSLSRAAPELRLPLPAGFLEGLDASIKAERGWGPIILLGRQYPNGVFYYFPLVWALKTPLLLACLQLFAVAQLVRSGALIRDPTLRFLALHLALTLAYFCFLFKTQIGFRFVLMCVPPAWILAATALREKRRNAALGAAIALAFAENLMYLGDPLAFTNAAVWPKRQVFRLMADASVDWGQNQDKIQGWLATRGIRASRLHPLHMLPGTNVLGLGIVGGLFDFQQFRWLREHVDPIEQLGHTYVRFEVDYETFDRFMSEERTLEPLSVARDLCAAVPDQQKPARTQIPFVRESPPVRGGAWLACVVAPRGTDLGYRVVDGRIRIGHVLSDGRCDAELVQHEQVIWYRLQPGRHALCALEVPSRRGLVPYRTEGTWILRGRSASVEMVPAAIEGARLAPVTR